MKFRSALLLLPALLAGCGGETSTGNNSTPAAPVAAVKPPAGQDWTQTVSATSEGGFVVGNPAAPIKLIEYGSRTCPTCGAFARDSSEPLMANYVATGKITFEFRDYMVHGAPDIAAAALGQCGGAEPFFPILEQMYGEQEAYLQKLQATPPAIQAQLQSAELTTVATLLAEQMGLIDFVKQRGIPEAQARACLKDKAKLEALAKATETATASGTVTGTPTFLLNGKKLDNTVSWTQVEAALKDAGA